SATGSFNRTNTYQWNLKHSVSPSSAQFTSGSGNTQKFTHTLTACRTLLNQMDSFGVGGQVCVTNGGSADTMNLAIVVKVQYQVGGGTYQELTSAVPTV